jgi:hypothetical protein
MQIEKCVIFLRALDPMARSTGIVMDGRYRVPVTLPRLKCLDDEPNKYFPYTGDEIILSQEAKDKLLDDSSELTEREKYAYEAFKRGEKIKNIASDLRQSSNDIRLMIFKAKNKMGEKIQLENVRDRVRDKDKARECEKKRVRNPPKPMQIHEMIPRHKEIFDLYKSGLSCEEIGKRVGRPMDSVGRTIRLLKQRLGDQFNA